MQWEIEGYEVFHTNIDGVGFDVFPERVMLIEALDDWISMMPVTQWAREYNESKQSA